MSRIKVFQSAEELDEPEEAEIIGDIIPEYSRGTLFRNGPGKTELSGVRLNHYLDGYAILSKFDIEEKSVKLTKKFLDSEAYKGSVAAGGIPVISEFGTKAHPDPNRNILLRHIPSLLPQLTDNGNISIFKLGNEMFVSNETNYFHSINPDNLTSSKKFDTNKLFGLMSACPHPIVDPRDGSTYHLGVSMKTGLKYKILKIPPLPSQSESPISPTLKTPIKSSCLFKYAKTLCTIPSSSLTTFSYFHTFGMSENYLIFIEQPLLFNVSKVVAATLSRGQSVLNWLEWREDVLNRFYIIEKKTGKVLDFEIYSKDPFFFLHIINSFEDEESGEFLTIDIFTFPNANFVLETLVLENILKDEYSGVNDPITQRFVIPVGFMRRKLDNEKRDENGPRPSSDNKNKKSNSRKESNNEALIDGRAYLLNTNNSIHLIPEILTQSGLEFANFNEKLKCKNYRYFYASGSASVGAYGNSLCKIDLHVNNVRGERELIWKESEFYFPGEPIFVQDPKGDCEDDGILLSLVTNTNGKDFLLFLNAKDMKEIGRAEFNARISLDFHGLFVHQSDLPSLVTSHANQEILASKIFN